jgi:hypothetical protein
MTTLPFPQCSYAGLDGSKMLIEEVLDGPILLTDEQGETLLDPEGEEITYG